MQVADIDLTEETAGGGIFYHDGNGWTAFDTFTGNYNGDTHTITGLQTTGNGLFSINSGVVQNLGMVDGNVTGSISGGIAGENKGTISNCYNIGNVVTSGITGTNSGTISDCYNSGNIIFGGIAGQNYGTINNCYNTGNVIFSDYNSGGSNCNK